MFEKILNTAKSITAIADFFTEATNSDEVSFTPAELLDEIRSYPATAHCGYITMYVTLFLMQIFGKK